MKRHRAALLALLAATSAHAGIEPLRAIAQRGGKIEPGRYICRQQYNAAGYTEKVVEIASAAEYAYIGSQRYPGPMKYDVKTGQMQFTGGKLGNGFEGFYGRRDNGYPIFVLVDRDLAPKADAYDLCVRRADK
ncbi:MAG TPA: hypothetical protein VIM12_12335 [Noviherbaspirillum sp.]|jgi:hypothetical protein|uniref:hypothetical protein n=1 Tax=Noviherbaspirillum sp. TaxID=1926288 RepID=UPI002F93C844